MTLKLRAILMQKKEKLTYENTMQFITSMKCVVGIALFLVVGFIVAIAIAAIVMVYGG